MTVVWGLLGMFGCDDVFHNRCNRYRGIWDWAWVDNYGGLRFMWLIGHCFGRW